jgi:inosine-uridine nucleoside N-ribohydrolase
MHDSLAVAAAVDPTLVTKRSMLIDLELWGALTLGQIVADRRRRAEGRENMEICVDVELFIDRFTEALVTLGA